MANQMFYPGRQSLEPGVVEMFMRVTFGASGAPTLDTANSRGVTSITRTAAGAYDILLSDSYSRFLFMQMLVLAAADPAAPCFQVISEAVSSSTAPKISVQYNAADAATATDPASGEEHRMCIVLKNSIA